MMFDIFTHVTIADFSEKEESIDDLIDWCRENIGPAGKTWIYVSFRSSNRLIFTFVDKEKALLFKLRWV